MHSSLASRSCAGTPEDAIRLLNREVVRVLQDDEVRAKFLATGVEPRGTTAVGRDDDDDAAGVLPARVVGRLDGCVGLVLVERRALELARAPGELRQLAPARQAPGRPGLRSVAAGEAGTWPA